MTSILPTVDFSPFLNGNLNDQTAVAKEIGKAFENQGFLTLVGHGVDASLIAQMRSLSRVFFCQPSEAKEQVLSQPKAGRFCGFVPFGKDSAATTYHQEKTPPDLRERYRAVCSSAEEVVAMVGTNQWPLQPADFSRAWTCYYRALERLSSQLLQACALALDLPKTGLTQFYDRHFSVLVAAHSPLATQKPSPGQQRCGAHCDFGTLTLVHQEEGESGLQIYSEGQWRDIPAQSSAFVVNIGDLMARWTNDRWVSTLHRVVPKPGTTSSQGSRLSLIYFNQPNLHAEIRCLEPCWSPDQPPKYEPTTLQQHFSAQQKKLMEGQTSP